MPTKQGHDKVYVVNWEHAHDPFLEHASRVIYAKYGVNVKTDNKNKDVLKFGRNHLVRTSSATVMTLPAGILNETYVSTNAITSVVSTSGSDTETITVEGHTVDGGGDFSFVSQTVTLTGQTAATLGTALARCSRAYNSDTTELVGTISITQNDTYSSGVPDTAAGVHCQILAPHQNSHKASTTVSSTDYLVVTEVYGDCLKKQATSADITLEVRLKGGVFLEKVTVSCSNNHAATRKFKPYIVVPPSSDIRLVSLADGAGTDIVGGIEGVLMS